MFPLPIKVIQKMVGVEYLSNLVFFLSKHWFYSFIESFCISPPGVASPKRRAVFVEIWIYVRANDFLFVCLYAVGHVSVCVWTSECITCSPGSAEATKLSDGVYVRME